MKYKEDQISFINLIKVFKGVLFLYILLLANSVSGQNVGIQLLPGPNAAEQGLQTATFRITRNASLINILPLTINYTLSGSAVEVDDFEVIGAVVIPANATQVLVEVVPIDDAIVEGDHDVIFTIDPGSYTISGTGTAMATIEDNDVGIISLNTTGNGYIPIANEGANNGRFRMESDLVNEIGTSVAVTFDITGTSGPSGAGSGFDHNLTGVNAAKTASTILNNGTARNINVIPFDDAISEVDKTVIITLTGTNNPNFTIDPLNNTATVTIIDDDCIAGDTAPALNNDPTAFCGPFSVILDTYYSGAIPAGADLVWSTNLDPTVVGSWLPNNGSVSMPGTYYVFFADTTQNCYSPVTTHIITQSNEPSSGTPIANIPEACINADPAFTPRNIDLDLMITGEDAGTWLQTGGPNVGNIPGNNVINFDNRAAGNYEFTFTTTGAVLPCTDQSTTITITAVDCDPCVAGDTPPPLNTNTPQNRCDENSVNLNTFIVGAAGSAPSGTTLRWSLIPNPALAADLLGSATATTSNTYYGVFWDAANTCASPSTQVDLVFNTSPSAGVGANAAACNNDDDEFGDTAINLNSLLAAGVTDTGDWTFTSGPETINPTGGGLVEFSNRMAGPYVYTFTTNNAVAPCTNDSAVFTITVDDCDPCVAGNTAPVIDPAIPTTFCDIFTASFNDYTNSTPPNGTTLVWSLDSDPENTQAHLTPAQASSPPTVGGTYYGFFFDATNSCGSPVLQIDLVLNSSPTLSNVTGAERCDTGVVVLTATGTAGVDNATVNWYASETSSGILGTGTSFTTPVISTTTSYYAEATFNGCTSERQQAIATIVEQPSAGTPINNGNVSACSDPDNGPTILDLDDLISGEDAGNWTYTSGPLQSFNILSNNILNFEGLSDGTYVFTYTTIGAQAPCSNETSEISIIVSDCDVDTDLDGLFDGVEAALGTNPTNPDTDGDGVNDGEEVGMNTDNPIDEDDDGVIDALDSNILDSDLDGVVDQVDPANENPCVPTRLNGVCDFDLDDVPDVDDIEPDNPCAPDTNHPNCNPLPVDLQITKEIDNINAQIGDEITFTITLTNLDPVARSRDIIISESISDGFEYISHEASIGTYDLQAGEWNIAEIEPLAVQTLTITVMVLESGTYDNTAELVDSFPEDDKPGNNRANVTLPLMLPENVNLILEKTVSLGVGKKRLKDVTGLISGIEPELEVIYYLKVINNSAEDVVSNIVVSDIFTNEGDVEYELIENSALVPTGTTFNEVNRVWEISSLAVDAEIELSYRVAFKNEGFVTNVALIESSMPRESALDDADSESSANVEITTRNEVEIGILYNQFSPNDDGLNDDLKVNFIGKNVEGEDVEVLPSNRRYDIQIFNRYGNLVFETAGKNDIVVWDGSWNGKDAPDGTYFYTMNLAYKLDSDSPEIRRTQKGWIQLIR